VGLGPDEVLHTHLFEGVDRHFSPFGGRDLAHLQTELDIVGHGPGKQQRRLVDHHHLPPQIEHVAFTLQDRISAESNLTGTRAVKKGQDFEQCRLAGAIWSGQGVNSPRPDGKPRDIENFTTAKNFSRPVIS